MAVENQIIVEIVSWGPKGEPGEFQVATNWLGVYNPATAYVQNDGVKFNGSAYTCLAAVTGEDPDASASWLLIVEKGDASTVTGPVGPEGPVGPQGVPGRLSIYGTAVPTTEGVDGDFYIKTDTYDLYGPKTAGAWGTPVSLIGPVGPQGTGASTWAEVDKTLSTLESIADVPAPIANKVLKRNLEGTAYEWSDGGGGGLSITRVDAGFSGYTKDKIQADLVVDGTLEPEDYWNLFLDGNMYSGGGIVDPNDTFDGPSIDPEKWSIVNYAYGSCTIENSKLRLSYNNTGGTSHYSHSHVVSKALLYGGWEIEFDTSRNLVGFNTSHHSVIGFHNNSSDNSNLIVRLHRGGGLLTLYALSNGTNYFNSSTVGYSNAYGTVTTPLEECRLRFRFDGIRTFTMTLSEDDGQTWKTEYTVDAPQLAPANGAPLKMRVGVKYPSSYAPGNWHVYFDNFTWKSVNGGWITNSSMTQRTLLQHTDTLISYIPTEQYTVTRLGDTSFTVEKVGFGAMTASWLASASDSITITQLTTAQTIAPTDYWDLTIDNVSYQITGASAATINDVTEYFMGIVNGLIGFVGVKIDQKSMIIQNSVPGVEFIVTSGSSPVNLVTLNTGSSLYSPTGIPVDVTGFTNVDLTDNTLQKVLLKLDALASLVLISAGFNGVLSPADDTVAKAITTLDQMVLSNIKDVPAPSASKVLKRNAENTAYEWLDIEARVLQVEDTNALTTYTQAAAIGELQVLHIGDIFPD